MDDPTDRPTPPPRPLRRPRRFVMPVEHHDSRTSERIEAFLEGPSWAARRRRSAARRPHRPHRPVVLATLSEWHDALQREEVRVVRYGRPTTLMVVDVAVAASPDGPGVTAVELVPSVLEAIRHEARETDRVVRTLPTRFHLLLPETGEMEAHHLAERLRRACADRLNGHGAELRVRVESVTPGHGTSLTDAIHATDRRLAG